MQMINNNVISIPRYYTNNYSINKLVPIKIQININIKKIMNTIWYVFGLYNRIIKNR